MRAYRAQVLGAVFLLVSAFQLPGARAQPDDARLAEKGRLIVEKQCGHCHQKRSILPIEPDICGREVGRCRPVRIQVLEDRYCDPARNVREWPILRHDSRNREMSAVTVRKSVVVVNNEITKGKGNLTFFT